MRQARFLLLPRRQLLRVVLAGGLAGSGSGCQQPPCYYYYGVPPCGPVVPAPSAVQSGSVCQVPTQVIEGGTTLADGATRSATVSGVNSTRVVISEPSDSQQPRLTWRRTGPDGRVTTTSVDGAVDDGTITR
jgi:hypothetical protein